MGAWRNLLDSTSGSGTIREPHFMPISQLCIRWPESTPEFLLRSVHTPGKPTVC
jgi:hypothetical protein